MFYEKNIQKQERIFKFKNKSEYSKTGANIQKIYIKRNIYENIQFKYSI